MILLNFNEVETAIYCREEGHQTTMPHKHKRRRRDDSEHFDLPPTKIAKPLPAKSRDADNKESSNNKKRKSKKSAQDAFKDDTPKAFLRMMNQFQKATSGTGPRTRPSIEDDGTKPSKKRRRGEQEGGSSIAKETGMTSKGVGNSTKSNSVPQPPVPPPPLSTIPKILPGERMADFSARVNQALPLSGISRKSGSSSISKDPALKNLREHRQTKHERRLLRLQRGWREEEARIREREEAEREEREAEEEEVNEQWKAWEAEAGLTKKTKTSKNKKKKKKKKSGKSSGASGGDGSDANAVTDNDDDDDPWAKLNRKAKAMQPANPLEVVQAPPEQLTKPKEKFKVRGMGGARVNVANVPSAAGSLRAREELAEQRQSIVDEYRRIMAEKRRG
ncbi:uncharacterized protein BDCG_06188 [Blastomyces dermatitidis ER-3]|uniref:Urease accessory protein UreD n=1 Tax=Ajellomyces dermatitidis (strain ER-3 / ATCC MYA-2586) TaxID=559297 RepID=A0ABP2F3B0_AJEDR|nr:uncharacterized protein BDCG_06188 [Blastomyces dermatitidis ER-3]EEQ91068.2 hypothetical protein BDCG_06188 [Blastomyces dermatitidis ER-3]